MFDDGTIKEYFANIIAENLISLVGDEGRIHRFFSGIIDHRTDRKAVSKDDGAIIRNCRSPMREPIKCWYIFVKWKDDSISWVHLKDLKQSNPLEVSEYAVANKLVSEPAFQWWVPTTVRRRDRIISKLNKRYMQHQQKCGIDLPKTVKEAYLFDAKNGNTK